jgi:hypothetical protein
LTCNNNQLTNLIVSGHWALLELWCAGNQLTSLTVSGCPALQLLYCNINQLTATALNTVLTALPIRSAEDKAFIAINNNPGTETCNQAIAKNKGWTVYY